jgi:hypothetical protein
VLQSCPFAACGKSYEATGSTILTPAHGLRRTCKGRSSRLFSGRGLQTGPQLALRLCCRIGNFRKRRDALHNLRTAETSTEAPGARRNNRTPFQKNGETVASHLMVKAETHGEGGLWHAAYARWYRRRAKPPLEHPPCAGRVSVGLLGLFIETA